MRDIYLPTKGIELRALWAQSLMTSDESGEVSNFSDIPDTESIVVQVWFIIGETLEDIGGLDFSTVISTGECRHLRPYRYEKETFAELGSICLSTFNGHRALKVIEELIAQCDEGTLYSSMPNLRNYFEYDGYPFGPDE